MRPHIPIGILCLALAAPLAAQDSKPDLAKELKELRVAYQKAEREFFRPMIEARTDAEREQVKLDPNAHPAKTFAPKLEDLARRAKGSDVALEASVMLLQLGAEAGPDPALIAQITKEHIGSAKLERFVAMLAQLGEDAAAQQALETIAKDSPHKPVRAAALLAGVRGQLDGELGGAATKVLEKLVAEYGDTRSGKQAKALLQLAEGKEAPDFEGTDQHDKKVKLSELRGKVVLLDFWGYW